MPGMGRILRDIRKSRGLTLDQTSKCGISATSLSKFECGKTQLSARNLFKLMKYLGVTLADVYVFMSEGQDVLSLIGTALDYYAENNLPGLSQCLDQLHQLYEDRPVNYIQLGLILVKSAIQAQAGLTIKEGDLQAVFTYLIHSDLWLSLELSYVSFYVYLSQDCTKLSLLGQRLLNQDVFVGPHLDPYHQGQWLIIKVVEKLILLGDAYRAQRLLQAYFKKQAPFPMHTEQLILKFLQHLCHYQLTPSTSHLEATRSYLCQIQGSIPSHKMTYYINYLDSLAL